MGTGKCSLLRGWWWWLLLGCGMLDGGVDVLEDIVDVGVGGVY
jgi:hypothetical protein